MENEEDIYEIFNEFNSKSPDSDNLDRETFKKTFEDLANFMNIESYEEISYVDSDGYIIDEEINMNISYDNIDGSFNLVSSQNIKVKIKNWNIEEEIQLQFPEIIDKKEN